MTEKEAKYLGAFLHDIGKFTYRSQSKREKHESLGITFVNSIMKDFRVFDGNQRIINLVNSSINSSPLGIHPADVAAAKEREEEERNSNKTRRPLISIFSRVNIDKPDKEAFIEYRKKGVYYLNPSPLKFDVQMPKFKEGIDIDRKNWVLTQDESDDMIEKHSVSYKKFKVEVGKLKDISDFRSFFTSFYTICEKYTANVCSAGFVSIPDISLFDHSRNVAALAVCNWKGDQGKECLLIKGDISGIQNFIYYDILDATKAAKQLRGRSFIIRLLTDTIVDYLLNEFDVFDANVFFNSGGHFVIIVPNNKDNRDKIKEKEKYINEKFLEMFKGKLHLILSTYEETSEKVMTEFSDVYHKLDLKNQQNKKRKSFSILDKLMLETIEHDSKYQEMIEEFYINIGDQIPKTDYLIEIFHDENTKLSSNKEFVIDFSEFGISYMFSREKELGNKLNEINQNNIDRIVLHNLRKTRIVLKNEIQLRRPVNIGYSFKYIGSSIPMLEDFSADEIKKYELNWNNTILSFEDIAKVESEGNPMLGILRMDVDSLGMLFGKGLKRGESIEEKKLYSISRLGTLSRELEHFFAGHLNSIAEKMKVYLVYSGGDDLFAVGSWIKIIEFAQEVREEFRKFTCNNPNFSISGGIVFVKDHFPIANSADMAGKQEEKAKEADTNKDHISLFYRELKWETLEDMIDKGDKILQLIDDRDKKMQVPRGFIHTLLSLTQQCFDDNGSIELKKIHQITSKMHYFWARRDVDANEMQKRELGFKTDMAEYFMNKSIEERKNWYYNFAVPASYVLLKTRNLDK